MTVVGLIEDEAALAESVSANLKIMGYQSIIFPSAEKYLLYNQKPELEMLLVDRNLPGLDGLSLVKKIRESNQTLPILFVTAEIEPESAVEGLQAGADDYIRKPFSTIELVERMKKTVRLRTANNENSTNAPLWKVDPKAREILTSSGRVRMTQTEFDLTEMLLDNSNRVVDRATLGKKFEHLDIDNSRTMDVHISSIRKKLAPLGLEVETIRGVGYRILTF